MSLRKRRNKKDVETIFQMNLRKEDKKRLQVEEEERNGEARKPPKRKPRREDSSLYSDSTRTRASRAIKTEEIGSLCLLLSLKGNYSHVDQYDVVEYDK